MAITVVVGLAGSGKTEFGLGLVENALKSGLQWHQIGYSSFSRAACLTAVTRAANLTGESIDRMQNSGFYKTLHSAALRCLGVDPKCILDHDTVEGKKFLTDCLGGVRGGERGTLGNKIDEALSSWDKCRSRLDLLSPVYGRIDIQTDGQTCTRQNTDAICASVCANSHIKHCDSASVTDANPYPLCIEGVKPCNFNAKTQFGDFVCPSVLSRCKCPICIDLGKDRRDDRQTKCLSVCLDGFKMGYVRGIEGHETLIQKYERAKKLYGRLDFTDILMSYCGITADEDLQFVRGYPNGSVPEEVRMWIFDEAQDLSQLLGETAMRISGFEEGPSDDAGDVFYLGDRYQTVYQFSGVTGHFFASMEDEAKKQGNRILLRRSWRNPGEVLEWGEQVLREDGQYDERNPTSETGEGSVGLLDLQDFWAMLPKIANTDSMILCRTWHGLNDVKRRLDELTVPWRSCNEQTSSRWECPAKIAYTLVMRELMAGDRISEQDWRRVTETLPQKWDGKELFVRGTKAKWKKIECRREPEKGLSELMDWGATEVFAEFVRQGKWRTDQPLLLDLAITKYGIDAVRKPAIQLGSVHSVKGGEARNVFCLASSTGRVDNEADPMEEICLKYVAITRASKHYRLVVDRMDLARGRPVFWSAPKGSVEWRGLEDFRDDADLQTGWDGTEDERIEYPGEDRFLGGEAELDLDCEGSRGTVCEERDAGPDSLRDGTVRGHRDEDAGRQNVTDAEIPEGEDQEEWWNL